MKTVARAESASDAFLERKAREGEMAEAGNIKPNWPEPRLLGGKES